eukprot:s786_g16.t1
MDEDGRLRQSLREIEEKVPRLLSLGGREGPGQQINGDYELLEGVRPNGRPCWLRRGRPLLTVNSNGLAEHDGDLKPLYLFFGEMGYWNIAASVLAAGVHVLARSGPDFSSVSPDLCQMPWTIFAFGKAHKDSSIVCFRHLERNKVPEVVHVTGCRGDHGQLNGNYQLLRGVRMGSRPIFVKDGFGARGEEERKVLHFTQRAGKWFISSVTLSALEEIGGTPVGILAMTTFSSLGLVEVSDLGMTLTWECCDCCGCCGFRASAGSIPENH